MGRELDWVFGHFFGVFYYNAFFLLMVFGTMGFVLVCFIVYILMGLFYFFIFACGCGGELIC